MKKNSSRLKNWIHNNPKRMILFVVLLLVVVVGVSFALFYVANETDSKTLSTAYLKIKYIDGQTIKATNNLPIFDEEVDDFASKTNFTVKNTGDVHAYTTISLIINDLPNELNNEDFRWTLYRDDIAVSTGSFSGAGNKLVLKGNDVLEPNSNEVNYSIAIWIRDNGEDQNSMMNKQLNAKIDVTAVYKKLTNFAINTLPVLSDTNANDSIYDLKLYGNTVDGVSVGDLITDESSENNGKYQIPITISGKNLFNRASLTKDYTHTQRYGDYGIKKINSAVGGYRFPVKMKKDKTYYISAVPIEYNIPSDYSARGNFRFYNESGTRITGSYIDLKNINKTSRVILTPTDNYVSIEFYSQSVWETDSYYIIDNIMVSLLSDTKFEPYVEPMTYTVYLDEPLRSNGDVKDYIDFNKSVVVRMIGEDGSILDTPVETPILLPSISLLGATNILQTDTTVSGLFSGSY